MSVTRGRVAFFTQWFAPEPSVQPVRIARALRDSGYDVTVLTGIPNYPTGRVADGYKAWRGTVERFEGMRVIRAPLYPSHSNSGVGRMVNYLSWAGTASGKAALALRDMDVALVYSSPATAAMPAMVAQARYGIPFALLVQDVWPDSVTASGLLEQSSMGLLLERGLERFVRATYKRAAQIAVISPGMRPLLVSRGVPEGKVSVVYNSVDAMPTHGAPGRDPAMRASWGCAGDERVFMYAGNHGAAQGLSALVEAFSRLSDDIHARLVLVGDGVEKQRLRDLAQARGCSRITFLDPVPREQMPTLMAQVEVQIVTLADEPLFSVTMPSKLQSALAAAQPVLAVARGDVAHVVQTAGAGAVATPGDPESIAHAVAGLTGLPTDSLQEMGTSGRLYYEAHMSPERSAADLIHVLERSIDASGVR